MLRCSGDSKWFAVGQAGKNEQYAPIVVGNACHDGVYCVLWLFIVPFAIVPRGDRIGDPSFTGDGLCPLSRKLALSEADL